MKQICFPSTISVFSEYFQIKYFRNLLGSKYHSTMVTFISCADRPQISPAPISCPYLILLLPFWKMMSFETNGLRFLARNCAAFCFVCVLPQKQCDKLTRHYHSTTARYGLRNDPTFSLNVNPDNTRISTSKVLTFLNYRI